MSAKTLPVLALAALLLAACLDFDGDEEGREPSVTATPAVSPTAVTPGPGAPDEVIAAYARDELQGEYIGDCADAQLPDDAGKICTAFKQEREGVRAYMAGLAFSEFFTWLFVESKGGRWEVTGAFPIREEAADVPGIPWPLAAGAELVVAGTGDCLNLREGPGLEAPAVDCLADGTKVVLAQGPVEADGYEWWRVEGRSGWIAADWLRYPDAAQPSPAEGQ